MRRWLLLLVIGVGGILATAIFFIAGGMASLQAATEWVTKESQTASVFFVQSITIAKIKSDYYGAQSRSSGTMHPTSSDVVFTTHAKKVRILIMPGHRPHFGGTVFNGVYERNVVVTIADDLAVLLRKNPHYEVTVARTKTAWNPILQTYFDTYASQISAFMHSQRSQMAKHLANGSIIPETRQIDHDATPSKAALQLYGINKWANDNKYDITLHLHINDYAGRRKRDYDKYSGFAIYVPNYQFSNAKASKAVGESVAVRLNAFHATSTFPLESAGVVPDQDLIAIGSNNSVNDAVLLIEYGYIYEPQFQISSVRKIALDDYAYQTYLGLQDFFKDPVSSTYGTVSLPYNWSRVTGRRGARGPGIYALQSALHYLGYYPPRGRSFSNCPISGISFSCTRSAIKEYQRAHNLDTTGTLGQKTRADLFKEIPMATIFSNALAVEKY